MLMLAEEIHGVNIANRTFKVVMVFEIINWFNLTFLDLLDAYLSNTL
jgi:hypothetical protein